MSTTGPNLLGTWAPSRAGLLQLWTSKMLDITVELADRVDAHPGLVGPNCGVRTKAIQTALLTAAARMTREERDKLGLSLLGHEPLPGWLQGNLPIGGGITRSVNRYGSFGFFGGPAENVADMVAPVESRPIEALKGRDWEGKELGGSELSHIGVALKEFLTAFTPGFYTGEGLFKKGVTEEINPLRTYPRSEAQDLRHPREEISVPAKSSSSHVSTLGDVFGGSVGKTNLSAVFGGG